MYLSEHPLCMDCMEAGKVEAAAEVHHMRKAQAHHELRLDADNLMALCKVCHSARTARGE